MNIVIHVPAVPIAQPRQRHRVSKSKAGKAFVMNYTPSKAPVNDYKATVRLATQQVHSDAPLTEPLSVSLLCVMPRPSRLMWKTRPMPRVPHTSTPDCDNLAKSTCDALKQLLWVDDAQICRLTVEKWIASGDEQPHVVITVTDLARARERE